MHTLCAHVRSPSQHSTHQISVRHVKTCPCPCWQLQRKAPDRQGSAEHSHCTFSVPAASFVLFVAELLQALNSLFLPHAHLVISELRMPPFVIQTGCSAAQGRASWKSERHELTFSTGRISSTKKRCSTFITTSI